MQSVDVNTDEIAIVVEGVGRPHFVVIDVRVIPDVDDVVLVHDFQGDKLPVFLEVASAAGHIVVNIGQHLLDVRYLPQMIFREFPSKQILRTREQPGSILPIPFLNAISKNQIIQLVFMMHLNVNIRGISVVHDFSLHFLGQLVVWYDLFPVQGSIPENAVTV